MSGTITTIQRMSVHDGPGIRSVVFMKGCNMRCRWCHNPETWRAAPQLQYVASKCISCLGCTVACRNGAITTAASRPEISFDRCIVCGSCAGFCPSKALSIVGRSITPLDLWSEVSRDLPYFINSGGGVTVSGGEPLLQASFVSEFLFISRESGINTAIETNASLPWEIMESLVPVTDLWMCDLKMIDPRKHQEWTGVDNAKVLDNIDRLVSRGCDVIVRTPVVPGVNDSDEEIESISRALAPFSGRIRHELLGFHTLGFGKFGNLGMTNGMEGADPLPASRLAELELIRNKYLL